MNAWTKAEISIRELPDALHFRITRHDGWLGFVGLSFVIVVSLFMTWVKWDWFWSIAAIACAGSIFARVQRGRVSELIVTEFELIARGAAVTPGHIQDRLLISQVSHLEFASPEEPMSSGLYARHHWSYTCLAPDISREQAELILSAIYEKFPDLALGTEIKELSLFGKRDEVITLNLANNHLVDKSAPASRSTNHKNS